MSYKVHGFRDGQILSATPLNEMDDEIKKNSYKTEEIKADLTELTPIKSTTLPIATSENYSRFAIITQNGSDRLFINLKKNGSYEWFEFKQGDTPTEEAKFGFAIFGTSKFN